MLRARLEHSVLADMKGEPCADILKEALAKLVESHAAADTLHERLEELRKIEKGNDLLPEYKASLERILQDQPDLERVSLTEGRYTNGAGARQKEHRGPVGQNLDEILSNLESDLDVFKSELDQTIDAFRAVLPVAEKGGFAAMVLSGRSPFPEKILQSGDQALVYAQFYNRACAATITADMQVYAKRLDWLKAPSKDWKPSQ